MIHRDFDDPFERDDVPLDDDLRALLAQADAAPTLRPSRDLWPGIAARLDATADARPSDGTTPPDTRVLVFRAREDTGRAIAASRPMPRRWLAAAAVLLVAVSSGATYLATRPTDSASIADTRPTTTAASPEARTRPDTVVARESRLAASPAIVDPADALGASRMPDAPRTERAVRTVSRRIDASVPGAAAYDREIAALRAVVIDGQGDLDSATVDVLARNLRIIDAAIAASRAALARDPHSPFLGEQLTRALGQKVDLLRTAALLPST